MKKILLIAQNSLKDALRQKLVFLIVPMAVVLTLFSSYAMRLDLGHEQLKFVGNFTSGALGFFGALIAVVSVCQLFYSEIENKTVATLLAHPVRRLDFVAGKLLGEVYMILIFVFLVLFAGGISLYLAELRLAGVPDEMLTGARLGVDWAGFLAFGLLQAVKLSAIAAMSCFVCAVSRSMMFALVVSFMVVAASLISYSDFFSGGGFVLNAITYIVPNFTIFEPTLDFAFYGVCWYRFFAAFGYGAVYVLSFLFLSVWAFSSREI